MSDASMNHLWQPVTRLYDYACGDNAYHNLRALCMKQSKQTAYSLLTYEYRILTEIGQRPFMTIDEHLQFIAWLDVEIKALALDLLKGG